MHRKSRLLELAMGLQDSWMQLLVQLSLSVSRVSSEAASAANGNITKLAIAAGAEDWAGMMILSDLF
jgi:hypothetical protein